MSLRDLDNEVVQATRDLTLISIYVIIRKSKVTEDFTVVFRAIVTTGVRQMSNARNVEPKVDDRAIRYQYKGGRCLKCGKTVKSVKRRYLTASGCFELNYVDQSKKSPNYKNMIRRIISTIQLDEIDKCVLLCRECHTIFHAQGITARGTFEVDLGNGQVKRQTIRYKGIHDYKNQHLYLFSDERYLLQVFSYRLGSGKPIVRIARDLERSLARLLLATKRRRRLLIYDPQGAVLLAKKVDDTHYEMEYMVRFPIFTAELQIDDPSNRTLWCRNGAVIVRGQNVKRKGAIKIVAEYAGIKM